MFYKLMADAVVVVHLAFIFFVVLGGLLTLKYRWIAWLHLPAVFWGAFIEFSGWICPLTPLENHLSLAGGGTEYQGGFVVEYMMPVLYPAGLNQNTQTFLGIMVVIINLIIYGILFAKRYPASKIKG